MTAWLEISGPGSLSLSRRGELASDGTWASRDVVDNLPVEAVDCMVALDGDPPGIALGLAAWHVEDEEGSAWHPALRVRLRREDAARLRDFLTFALGTQP